MLNVTGKRRTTVLLSTDTTNQTYYFALLRHKSDPKGFKSFPTALLKNNFRQRLWHIWFARHTSQRFTNQKSQARPSPPTTQRLQKNEPC